MRIFILAMCLTVSGILQAHNLKAQDLSKTYISLQLKNSDLKSAFKKIENLTTYRFSYKSDDVAKYKSVNLTATNQSLEQVLSTLLKNTDLGFEQVDKAIIIKKVPQNAAVESSNQRNVAPLSSIVISGKVTDSLGTPLIGATISIKGKGNTVVTDEKGEFSLNTQIGDEIIVTYISYKSISFIVKPNLPFQNIVLHQLRGTLNEVVVVSTGYQSLPKERATGSFDYIDNKLLNRSVSTDILSRLDGVASGLILNKNLNSNLSILNQSPVSVRGRSTVYANPSPLIVVDNFPYNGDINNIDPNDIENVTILKDAAAASIWGVRSGNGVIVITTKKGKYGQPTKVFFNSNVTIGDKPNLFYTPRLSSSDYIDVEQFLYSKGYYNNTIANGYSSISPVVAILASQTKGQISADQATTQINSLRNQDVRNDLTQYFYRKSVNQQYFANLTGGGDNDKYYYSAGYDKNLLNLVNDNYNRIVLNVRNTYALIDKKLELTTGVTFTRSDSKNNNSGTIPSSVPYLKLADTKGNALAVPSPFFRQSYTDTAGAGKLLDWNYRPLDEIKLADNTTTLTDYQITAGLTYKIINDLSAAINYQYANGSSKNQNNQSQQSFYTRNLINEYTNINSSGITNPVPLGGILDQTNNNYESNDIRGQLNYSHNWKNFNSLTGIVGFEYQNLNTSSNSNRLYGYNQDLDTNIPVDFVNSYRLFYNSSFLKIPLNPQSNYTTTDHYISWFSNIAYNFQQRYTFSISGRKDESNLFGVNTNQKGVPLWSAGFAWNINNEKFYHINWLPLLKLRITEGFTGNIDKNISAYTTASIQYTNDYNALFGTITNPPNPTLRWEKDQITNIAVDFGVKKGILSGSVEYYVKNGTDLIGVSPLAPQTGLIQFTGNTANMITKGIDLTLNSQIFDRKFKWSATLLLSTAHDRVTKYNFKQGDIGEYLRTSLINPLVGNPVFSIYSYKWAGLDANGNPQGILDGKVTENYGDIMNSPNFSNLVYNGPVNPTIFGSLRNNFSLNHFDLSFLISYEFGNYFRRNSINYSSLFNGSDGGSPDFDMRWQKSGDEKITNVPAMIYPANANRDAFYTGSEILVNKGDNIRLQDFQLGYTFSKMQIPRLPFSSFKLYIYAHNLGILWRANKYNIDPDYLTGYPAPRTFAAGIKIDF